MNSKFLLWPLLLLSFSFLACGKNNQYQQVVTDIEVETRVQDDGQYVLSNFELNLGRAQLPFLHLDMPENYGFLRLYSMNGMNYLMVDINMSEVLKLPAGEATLPNGRPVPVDGAGVGIIEIPLNGVNGKVYVSHKDGMMLVGFALAIRQLDDIGSDFGTGGLFPTFTIKGVQITAGIFTSEVEGQTGVAAFANLGDVSGRENLVPYRADAFEAKYYTNFSQRSQRYLGGRLEYIKNQDQVLEIAK